MKSIQQQKNGARSHSGVVVSQSPSLSVADSENDPVSLPRGWAKGEEARIPLTGVRPTAILHQVE